MTIFNDTDAAASPVWVSGLTFFKVASPAFRWGGTALREAAWWACLAALLVWWAPTIALALLDVGTFYLRHRAVLWLVARLVDLGEAELAAQLLARSRRRVEAYGRARGWR